MILFKLTAIEEQQKHQTRMLQSLMNSSNGGGDDWKLPEDVSLPLNSLESLNQLEEVLKQKEKLKALVTIYFLTLYYTVLHSLKAQFG